METPCLPAPHTADGDTDNGDVGGGGDSGGGGGVGDGVCPPLLALVVWDQFVPSHILPLLLLPHHLPHHFHCGTQRK